MVINLPKSVPSRFDNSPKDGHIANPPNYRKEFEHDRWLKKKRRELKNWNKRHKGLKI